MDVQINVWAVILAAASSMAVGAVWYAKSVFGTSWIKLAKLDEKKMASGAPQALTIAFLSSLVMAYVLAHVTYLSNQFFGNSFMQDALSTAFWMWLGFQGLRIWMHDAFEQRRKKLTLITAGNALVTIMVMALIIGAMKP
jgi:hypothetical protein